MLERLRAGPVLTGIYYLLFILEVIPSATMHYTNVFLKKPDLNSTKGMQAFEFVYCFFTCRYFYDVWSTLFFAYCSQDIGCNVSQDFYNYFKCRRPRASVCVSREVLWHGEGLDCS
jgi:hypothetical protein